MDASVPSHDAALVTFDDPPVIEVALGVQFGGRVTDDTRTLGHFWPLIQSQYPRLEQYPALPPQIEDFGPPRPSQFEVFTEPPSPRYWFLSETNERVVQLQPDRLVFNWRKPTPDAEYPRYQELRPELEAHLDALLSVLDEDTKGSLEPTWCEVTYVNQVFGNPGDPFPPLSEILTLVAQPAADSALPALEHETLLQQYVIRDDDDPVGRLHISAAPGFRNADEAPLYTITLVARLRPSEPTITQALLALDRGRGLIVQGFRDITRPTMHEKWGLQD